MSTSPHNPIKDLFNACKEDSQVKVVVHKAPKVDLDYFKINGGEKELRERLASGELLQDLRYVPPPKIYENWKGPGPAPLVDGYKFKMRFKEGYIAYFKAPTGNWVIKSFHKDDDAISNKLDIDLSKLNLKGGPK